MQLRAAGHVQLVQGGQPEDSNTLNLSRVLFTKIVFSGVLGVSKAPEFASLTPRSAGMHKLEMVIGRCFYSPV